MAAYLVRRLLFSVVILWGAVTIVFVVLRLVPADPAVLILGSDATQEEIDSLRTEMGLDRSIVAQYGIFLGDMVQGDFGDSYRQQTDAMGLVLDRLPATIVLAVAALSIAVVIGIPLGLIAALRVNGFVDRAVSALSLLLQSLPGFWVGIVLILVFARTLQWFPSGGSESWKHLVLPAVTLALPFVAILTRMTRSGLLEVINESYIQTARAKGLSERIVIFPHAMRNALIPIITVVGLQFGQLLGGAVIIETVFAWTGIGRLLIDAIGQRATTTWSRPRSSSSPRSSW